MNLRFFPCFILGLAVAVAAQDATTPPPSVQTEPGGQGGAGQRGQGRGWGGGGMGRGTMGTVTEVSADHYTIRTESGETYTIHYSPNTRILKEQAHVRGEGGQRAGGEGAPGGSFAPGPLKATDIRVGDAIAAMGELDATAKSVGATMVLQIDPERARQMREMQASFGKTWIMGKVTAIDGVKVTLMGAIDNAPRSFVADENTTFRRRRDPITLADIEVGDTIRVEGAVKDGAFLATRVSALVPPPPSSVPAVPRGHALPPDPQQP